MKRQLPRFLVYFLSIGLFAILILVTAACSSQSVSTSATSTTPTGTLSSIAITPSSPPNLKTGFNQQFKAMATYSDGSTEEVTDKVTWTSDNPNSADFISAGGLLTGMKAGTTNITASLSGKTSSPVLVTVYAANTFQ